MPPLVRIPEPCHEDWNAMQPAAGGRHCAACSRLVVDFTDWEPEAIAAYLEAQAGTRVCGRFRSDVVAPEPERTWLDVVFSAPLPLLRKIAAAVLFFFGTAALGSCGGDSKQPLGGSRPLESAHLRDTPQAAPALLGESAAVPDTPTAPSLGLAAPVNTPDACPPKRVPKKRPAAPSPNVGAPNVTMGAPAYIPPPVPTDSAHPGNSPMRP